MRRALLVPLFLAASCGGSAGFRIDNVSLSPDDVPVNPGGVEMLKLSADVFDDRHDVLDAWFVAEDAPVWFDLQRGTGAHWSAIVPLHELDGLPAGTYRFDVHASDDAGRSIVLVDAVRLKISLD